MRAVTFTRDRPTWLIYLQLCIFATYLYGLSAALPLLRAELGVTQTVAGLHGTGMAIGGIVSGIALPKLTSRFGRRTMAWVGLVGMNAGVFAVALSNALPNTLLGYTLAGGSGAITLYVTMATLSDHHGPATGPAAISEANAVAVVAGIATSYMFSVAAGSAIGWRSAMYAPIIATTLLAVIMGRVWVPGGRRDAAKPLGTVPRVPYGWRFHLAGAVLLCCVALEFSFNLWAAELLAQQTGLTATAAATGLTAMLVGVACGRFGGARLVLRFRPATVLLGALTLTLAGWLLFWTSTITPLAYAGLGLSGLGLSVLFPLGLARIIDTSGGRPNQASGSASIWSGVGAGVGPLMLGALGDGFGTHTAFLLAPALIGLAAGGILSSRTRS